MLNSEDELKPNLLSERLTKTLEHIKRNGNLQVKDMAALQGVSDATIRRDLDKLEELGFVKRIHGGAVVSNISTTFEHMYHDKSVMLTEEKRRIAAQALQEIHDGDAIFLDSGTTTYQLGLLLDHKKNLTIITNDMLIASCLKIHHTSQVIVTGGIVRPGFHVLLGTLTENFIRDMRVDVVMLSADAIDDVFGISNANYTEAGIKSLLVKAAKRVIVVADRTKFGKVAVAKVCNIKEIDLIITDKDLPQDLVNMIIRSGVNIKCV
jgi:DeoR/GlpR family transcriptional regulator of sugar metabolism